MYKKLAGHNGCHYLYAILSGRQGRFCTRVVTTAMSHDSWQLATAWPRVVQCAAWAVSAMCTPAQQSCPTTPNRERATAAFGKECQQCKRYSGPNSQGVLSNSSHNAQHSTLQYSVENTAIIFQRLRHSTTQWHGTQCHVVRENRQ